MSIYNISSTKSDYNEKFRKEFLETLSNMINTYVIPNFGMNLKFNIEMGLFTSDNYGSHRISFFNTDGKEVCYIIADTILGIWELFKKN